MQFKYDKYLVKVKYKKNKHVYFRLSNDLTINITCPSSVDLEMLKSYLAVYISKIEKKYDIDEYLNIKYDLNEGYLYYLGHKYPYDVVNSQKNYLKKNNDKFEVFLKEGADLKVVIDNHLLKEAKQYLSLRFNEILSKFNHVSFDVDLKISKMQSRYGVCYPKRNQITLSTQLIHFDDDCIDYVIIHELAHFIHPNHSKKFYYLIEEYLPNYRMIEKKIKKMNIVK